MHVKGNKPLRRQTMTTTTMTTRTIRATMTTSITGSRKLSVGSVSDNVSLVLAESTVRQKIRLAVAE